MEEANEVAASADHFAAKVFGKILADLEAASTLGDEVFKVLVRGAMGEPRTLKTAIKDAKEFGQAAGRHADLFDEQAAVAESGFERNLGFRFGERASGAKAIQGIPGVLAG
jgi:hypothetical protein